MNKQKHFGGVFFWFSFYYILSGFMLKISEGTLSEVQSLVHLH